MEPKPVLLEWKRIFNYRFSCARSRYLMLCQDNIKLAVYVVARYCCLAFSGDYLEASNGFSFQISGLSVFIDPKPSLNSFLSCSCHLYQQLLGLLNMAYWPSIKIKRRWLAVIKTLPKKKGKTLEAGWV